MGKRFVIFFIVISMALFGSMAFAGDDWQDGFAKALDENNFAGALMLAHNSQASPQAVYEALDAFGVEPEEVEQSIMLAKSAACVQLCNLYQSCCCDASPCSSPDVCADAAGPPCKCTCDDSG